MPDNSHITTIAPIQTQLNGQYQFFIIESKTSQPIPNQQKR